MMPAATDMSLYDIRHEMGQDGKDPVRVAAQQFEALFIQTLMKNMREASLGDGIFDSQQQKLYEGMLDQQFAIKMASGEGIGIAEMLVRQLGGESKDAGASPDTGEIVGPSVPAPAMSAARPAESKPERVNFDSPESFVRELWPHVREVANKLGVEARAIMAQAALETGWGQHMPQSADGTPNLNLFGIKADDRWNGEAVTKRTLEYRDGIPQQESARFRVYESIAESVKDYFDFLTGSPRYEGVGKDGGDPESFGRSLKDAGYATDPHYADKILRVASSDRMNELIGELEGAEPLLDVAGAAADP